MSDVLSVSCNESHTCAYKKNGLVYCFGYHGAGKIGIGSDTNQNKPRELFDGSKGASFYCDDCCEHRNYTNVNNSCIPEVPNSCNEGVYLCYNAKENPEDNPSIICTAPNCCYNTLYSQIDYTCYSECYGVCKQDGTYYCNGEFTDS